jgi:recombination protein RecA
VVQLRRDQIGQGREAVKTLLLDNPELAAEIEGKIRTMAKGDEDVIPVDMSIEDDGEDTL